MASRRFVVGRVRDLADGEKMAVEVNGRSIAIFNVGGRFYGLLNRCPHRGADLCAGRFLPLISAEKPGEYVYDTERQLLACPWHGWEFDVTTGQSYFDPIRMRGRPYSVEVEKGDLIASELENGEVDLTPAQYAATIASDDETADGRQPGPYMAETVEISVEEDYLVVDLRPPRPARAARPERKLAR
ncbi:Rieske (2Fe-2S) protein [Aeromicrobium sp. YIM 150415]|uniref:Rieske (2Fe-2S) protein n=1 Tax=Aeromicrobium sp. YIM 150415 TaxID=2803912 RepID=UPI001964FAFA|nr:Rieske (2Fe-2S) protein [Aeromicrobium sp. YIM 150415]MBM9464063.1 Rieske (2Fe-2S) protein [Aeromicrobium sp. YIM 150415]